MKPPKKLTLVQIRIAELASQQIRPERSSTPPLQASNLEEERVMKLCSIYVRCYNHVH